MHRPRIIVPRPRIALPVLEAASPPAARTGPLSRPLHPNRASSREAGLYRLVWT
jgi:hypothetical protein